jgi:hypothetical protein
VNVVSLWHLKTFPAFTLWLRFKPLRPAEPPSRVWALLETGEMKHDAPTNANSFSTMAGPTRRDDTTHVFHRSRHLRRALKGQALLNRKLLLTAVDEYDGCSVLTRSGRVAGRWIPLAWFSVLLVFVEDVLTRFAKAGLPMRAIV